MEESRGWTGRGWMNRGVLSRMGINKKLKERERGERYGRQREIEGE